MRLTLKIDHLNYHQFLNHDRYRTKSTTMRLPDENGDERDPWSGCYDEQSLRLRHLKLRVNLTKKWKKIFTVVFFRIQFCVSSCTLFTLKGSRNRVISKKRKFSNFFCIILTNFLLRVLCHLDYSNRFRNLEDTKKYQKNTLTSPTALILKIFRKN